MIDCQISGGLCVLRLNSPPVNAISLALLDELLTAVRRANAEPEVYAIVITGGPAHFSAGADLADFQAIKTADAAVHMSSTFQAAFAELENSPKPVVAAVAGNVLGGALELAMACHFRIAAEGSRFSLPEIKLGINPGAGGTQRLPRLVGLPAALEMLLTGQAIDAPRALSLGLIDAVCAGEALLERARELVLPRSCPDGPLGATAGLPSSARDTVGESNRGTQVCRVGIAHQCQDVMVGGAHPTINQQSFVSMPTASVGMAPTPPRKTSEQTEKIENAAANAAALAEAETLVAASRAEIIAPRTILTAVRTGVEQSFAAGLLAEQEGFRQCMETLATQNKFYIFVATRQAPKMADGDAPAGPKIARAAVVGLGTMGAGIAQALLGSATTVVAYDENSAALARGMEKIRASLLGRVSQGKLAAARAEEMLKRLTPTTDRRQLAGAELVIESVFEDVAVKQAAIGGVEEVCAPETIIASNTSTISLDVLAQRMRHPERLLGMHFFNPAQRMPLVEVIVRTATPPGLAAAVMGFARQIGKTPILVKNREGFLVNRLFIPYLKEAFWLLESGGNPARIDRALVDFGFAMGPFVLIDMAGLDILMFTDALLRQAFPRHGGPADVVVRLVQQGHRGQKTGSGVYRYEKGNHQPQPNPATARIIGEIQQERGLRPKPLSDAEITRRLVLRMVNEAFYVLEEGLCQRSSDLDVAMVLGAGLADFRGGLVKYAHDLGLDRVRAELQELAAEHGERFTPSKMLQDL